MTDEEHEEAVDQYYKLGIIEGLRQASNKVFDLSVEAFKRDKDDEAKKMKALSKTLLSLSTERRKEYDKYYPK